MENASQKPARAGFKLRSFVSILVTLSFIVLVVTGIILFIQPQGRVAFWTNWTFCGLGKTQWDSVHIVAGFLLVIFGIFHLVYNFKPLLRYLGKAMSGSFKPTRELGIGAAIFLYLMIAGIMNLQPVSGLMVLNDYIKESWAGESHDVPPFGHAELKPLRMLCNFMGVDVDDALARLRAGGIEIDSAGENLEDIGRRNDVAPSELFRMIGGDRGGSGSGKMPGMGKSRRGMGGGSGKDGRPGKGGGSGKGGRPGMGNGAGHGE